VKLPSGPGGPSGTKPGGGAGTGSGRAFNSAWHFPTFLLIVFTLVAIFGEVAR
jgi:hypothetical protein